MAQSVDEMLEAKIAAAYMRYKAAWLTAKGLDIAAMGFELMEDTYDVMEPPPISFGVWCQRRGFMDVAEVIIEEDRIAHNTKVMRASRGQ